MPLPPPLIDRFREAVARWGSGSTLRLFSPDSAPTQLQVEPAAAFERAAASPGMAAALVEAGIQADLRDVLPRVSVPTLVIHRKRDLDAVEQGRTWRTTSRERSTSSSAAPSTSRASLTRTRC
jgi:pimeloyl-ACP methyl ester carboxylesterase